MSEPYGTTVFCDDLRFEIGNKITMVGCYGPDIIASDLPITLPKLGMHIRVFFPVDQRPKTLSVFVLPPGGSLEQPLFQAEVPIRELPNTPSAIEMPDDAEGGVSHVVLIINAVLANVILGEGSVRVRAIADGKEVKAGRLVVRRDNAQSP